MAQRQGIDDDVSTITVAPVAADPAPVRLRALTTETASYPSPSQPPPGSYPSPSMPQTVQFPPGGQGGPPPGGPPPRPSGPPPTQLSGAGGGGGASGDGPPPGDDGGGSGPFSSPGRLILIIAAAVILVGAAVFAGVMIVRSVKPGGSASPSPSVSTPPASPSVSVTASPSPSVTPSASPSASPSVTVQDLPKSAAISESVVVVPMRRGNDEDRPMFLVDTAGGDPVPLSSPLGNNSNPMMQPSRDTIIYLNAGVLRVMAADGSGDRKLFNGDPAGCTKIVHAAWSLADPNVLVISCQIDEDNVTLVVVGMDGRLIRRLDAGTDIVGEFALAPDGQTVVYSATSNPRLAGGALFTLPIIGTGSPKPLTDSADSIDDDPAWSPDGTQIAFRRRIPNGTSQGNFDVFVLAADGSGLRPIATTPALDFKPIWSPDSKNLLIISNRTSADGGPGKTFDLWLTRVSDKEVLANLGLKAKQITKPFWTLR